jgi:ArsR family transcriptional regulator
LRPGGRLLIVDFAAHTVDRLRDEFAHQRLGFADEQMGEWLRQTGLEVVAHEEIPPTTASLAEGLQEGLTVSVWLATRRGRPGASPADGPVLEVAR